MNDHERQLAAEHLRASRERLLGLVDGLTTEQWKFQPGEGRWSIGDCLEHVTRVENRVFGIIETKLQGPPAATSPEIRAKDDFLLRAVPERAEKRQAPEMVLPVRQWSTPADLISEFEKIRAKTTLMSAETKANLRGYTHPHGAFGELDCYQWLLLMGLHSERHARQIEEIKSDPAFPA